MNLGLALINARHGIKHVKNYKTVWQMLNAFSLNRTSAKANGSSQFYQYWLSEASNNKLNVLFCKAIVQILQEIKFSSFFNHCSEVMTSQLYLVEETNVPSQKPPLVTLTLVTGIFSKATMENPLQSVVRDS